MHDIRWARSHWQSTSKTTTAVVRPSARSRTREQAQAHLCSAGAENRCPHHPKANFNVKACRNVRYQMGAIALAVNEQNHHCGGKALPTPLAPENKLRHTLAVLELKTGALTTPKPTSMSKHVALHDIRWARSRWQSTSKTTTAVVRPSAHSSTREQAQAHPCSAGAENRCPHHPKANFNAKACRPA